MNQTLLHQTLLIKSSKWIICINQISADRLKRTACQKHGIC